MSTEATPLPIYVPEQVAHFLGDLLLTHPTLRFDPARAAAALAMPREALAVDIGGDKIRRARYAAGDGRLERRDEQVHRARAGAGYLAVLEAVAAEARASGLPVGISSATKMNGSVIARTVNLPVFLDAFRQRYDADYANLLGPDVAVANDTVSGACAAATLLARRGEPARDVAFFICGSGLGAAVITGGEAIHVEAAHVPIEPALNPLGQRTPCGVEGRAFPCLDRIVPARAGIEDLYRQRTGEALDGIAIAALYDAGDPLATTLFETSAVALAHAIAGVTQRYGFGPDAAVVLHGGMFEVARYRDAVLRALEALPIPTPRVTFARELTDNTCLDGAAILALTAEQARGDAAVAGS